MAKRPLSHRLLTVYFVVFLLFLYSPLLGMFILSFQGPKGGATFPMQGVDVYWWKELFSERSANIQDAIVLSVVMGVLTALLTAIFSTMLGVAFRQRFRGSTVVFYTVILALMTPGILLDLGVSLLFRILDFQPAWYTSGLGVHVTWALPFGLLVMLAAINRFDKSLEEAGRDLGASNLQVFFKIFVPLVWTGIFGAALFGFTLSWNEFDRSLLVLAERTLPLQIFAMSTVEIVRPSLYALGTLTTLVTFATIALYVAGTGLLRRRARRLSSDEASGAGDGKAAAGATTREGA